MRKDVPNIPYVAEAQENDFTQVCIQMAQWFCSWKLEKFTLGQTRRLSLTRSLNASRLLYHLTIFDAYIYMYISKTVCKENNKNLWKALARSWTSSEKLFSINIYIYLYIYQVEVPSLKTIIIQQTLLSTQICRVVPVNWLKIVGNNRSMNRKVPGLYRTQVSCCDMGSDLLVFAASRGY